MSLLSICFVGEFIDFLSLSFNFCKKLSSMTNPPVLLVKPGKKKKLSIPSENEGNLWHSSAKGSAVRYSRLITRDLFFFIFE